jgi:hypothetical protein
LTEVNKWDLQDIENIGSLIKMKLDHKSAYEAFIAKKFNVEGDNK